MKSTSAVTGALLVAAALAALSTPAQAYFVRPYVSMGAGVVDGYVAGGVTESSASFTSALQADVSLDTGTIRNYLQITGPGISGQASGVMGDRWTVNNAQGTNLNFYFDFDGTLNAPARDPNLNSLLQIGMYANLFVFAAGSGATYTNFDVLPGALVSQTRFLEFNNPDDPIENLTINQSMAGSFVVAGAGRQSYDVFYSLSVFTSTNSNPGTVTMDFSHTATAAVVTAPGITFTSESGVFLGSGLTPPVPEPGTYLLMAFGLATVCGAARRKLV
jgi:PEP-CTERM motif